MARAAAGKERRAALAGRLLANRVRARPGPEWVNSHKATVQKMADALAAAVHWIHTHSAAQIAARLPAGFVGARRQGKLR